jgi:hypothetical protein
MGTIAELQGKPDRLYPLLWLSNEGGSLEDNYKVDNIRLTMFRRVIAGEEGQDDDASEIEVLSDMQLILLDFLNYFHQQHGQEYVTDKAATLEHFTERTNDRTAGYSVVLELKQFYDWNKCQIPESGASIPPTVDGLTLYDFCDADTIARLTAEQIICLEAEFGDCDPVTEQVNGVTIGTAASGSTNNQVIQDSASNPVGTAANPSVVADATVENSNATASVTVKAEGTETFPDTNISANGDLVIAQPSGVAKDVAVRYETQGTVPTTIVSGEVVVPDAPVAGSTVTIGVFSDIGLTNPITDANFGDTVYVNLDTTGITPTTHRFFLCDNGLRFELTSQTGATLTYTVVNFNNIIIYAESVDSVTNVAACAFSAFELTVNSDADARTT